MDPLNTFEDNELWDALEKTQMKEKVKFGNCNYTRLDIIKLTYLTDNEHERCPGRECGRPG